MAPTVRMARRFIVKFSTFTSGNNGSNPPHLQTKSRLEALKMKQTNNNSPHRGHQSTLCKEIEKGR
jgi:hypothetical protein